MRSQKAASQVKWSRRAARAESRRLPIAIEQNHLALAAEHRGDSDPPAEVGEVGAAGHADVLAVVHQLAGRRILKRARATAQPGPAFQKRQSQAAIHEARGDRQAGEPAADDEDMRCRGNGCHFSGTTDSL